MKNLKRRIEYYPLYDRDGIAAHLESMAAEGWQLERITATFGTTIGPSRSSSITP